MLPSQIQLSLKEILVQLFASTIESLKGPKILFELPSKKNEIESLMGYSINGYTIKIHCLEKKYICRYRNWYISDKIKTVYHVYTTVSEDAPDILKKYCSVDRHFPRLLGYWMPSATQKEAAIEAYLDLIINDFKQIKSL